MTDADDSPSHDRRRLELLAALVLGLGALAASWVAFRSGTASGDATTAAGAATAALVDANYFYNQGHEQVATDTQIYISYLDANARGDDDLAAMRAELDAAMRAGAFGFTTSRTVHHQTSDDKPVASRIASWDEVCALVDVLAELGAGVFQMVTDRVVPDGDPDEMLADLALSTGVPVATTGTPVGVTEQGGVLDVVTHALDVRGPSTRIPDHLTIDVAQLGVHQHVTAAEVALPDGFTLVTPPDTIVVSVSITRATAGAGTDNAEAQPTEAPTAS